MLNSSGLFELQTLLFSFDKSDYCESIKTLLLKDWDPYSRPRAEALKLLMKNIKLPRFVKTRTSLQANNSVNNNGNLNWMLRELYLQRMALEAVSKQKIAESQLCTLIQMFREIAPKDYDFSQVIKLYGDCDSSMIRLLTSESSSHEDSKKR